MKHHFDFDEDYRMLSSETIATYLHGGRGEVTLASPTGVAHRYLFSEPRNADEFPVGTIFVYALHEGRRFYLGMLDNNNQFRLTSRSQFKADTETVKGAMYIAKMASDQNLVDQTQMMLYHSGKCCRCGRLLSSGKSISCGLGKSCRKQLNKASSKVQIWDGNS